MIVPKLVVIVPLLLAGCGTQVIKVPVDTRCQKQVSITLTKEEATVTPRPVLDKINESNCQLWLYCSEMYEAPEACKGNP